MPNGLPLYVVDAFTEHAFAGNPAAVCLTAGPVEDEWMRRVAAEMNLSETAFLLAQPSASGDSEYALRWWTPVCEVTLCGHATLAAAHVLWSEGHAERERAITFRTRGGALLAERGPRADGADGAITLDFPALSVAPRALSPDVREAIGVETRFTGRTSEGDDLVEVASAAIVADLRPDLRLLAGSDARGVIVTARGDGEVDFVSRFFAPSVGVPEDPVTGSAHCALAPFWSERLALTELTGRQLSARGGTVMVRVRGDRVDLTGHAVTVVRGTFVA